MIGVTPSINDYKPVAFQQQPSNTSTWGKYSPSAVSESSESYDDNAIPTLEPSTAKSIEAAIAAYDFKSLDEQDPLEWLVEQAEPSILPESSLPVFPDLKSAADAEPSMQYHTLPYNSYPTATAEDDDDDVKAVSDASSTGTLHAADIAETFLENIADPNVTVQSLFLMPDSPPHNE